MSHGIGKRDIRTGTSVKDFDRSVRSTWRYNGSGATSGTRMGTAGRKARRSHDHA
jgi:hypothetical protein